VKRKNERKTSVRKGRGNQEKEEKKMTTTRAPCTQEKERKDDRIFFCVFVMMMGLCQ